MSEKKVSFEEALARLEEIVRELESGKATLDRSLEAFEEGIGLVKLCGARLDEAEQKVTVLLKNSGGDYEEKPFDEN